MRTPELTAPPGKTRTRAAPPVRAGSAWALADANVDGCEVHVRGRRGTWDADPLEEKLDLPLAPRLKARQLPTTRAHPALKLQVHLVVLPPVHDVP